MLILNKNDRNVRFVPFMKTSTEFEVWQAQVTEHLNPGDNSYLPQL